MMPVSRNIDARQHRGIKPKISKCRDRLSLLLLWQSICPFSYAKKVTGRTDIIAFENSYHGSTQGALSVIGAEYWRNASALYFPELVTWSTIHLKP
jgi:hypothetical protein